jgi:hypothetical protein
MSEKSPSRGKNVHGNATSYMAHKTSLHDPHESLAGWRNIIHDLCLAASNDTMKCPISSIIFTFQDLFMNKQARP